LGVFRTMQGAKDRYTKCMDNQLVSVHEFIRVYAQAINHPAANCGVV
jgi:hypothetical protein